MVVVAVFVICEALTIVYCYRVSSKWYCRFLLSFLAFPPTLPYFRLSSNGYSGASRSCIAFSAPARLSLVII